MSKRRLAMGVVMLWLTAVCCAASAAELAVGAASVDITPEGLVALDGHMGLRVTEKKETPITASVIALESREGDRSLDAAVMVSCDLLLVSDVLSEEVAKAVGERLPGFDVHKLMLNATHTHTAPLTRPNLYQLPEGVMTPEAYCRFAAGRIAEAIERAWNGRQPGSVTWGLGHAAIAENRRAVYADGTAVMYGKTDQAEFRGLEGYVDHDVNAMFFFNAEGKLLATAVDVACPAQEVESAGLIVHADFWDPARRRLRERFGPDACVLGLCGAAGDQSSHLMYRKAAEERMCKLRKLSRVEEFGRRLAAAVEDIYEVVKEDRHDGLPLVHKTEMLQLPARRVTEAEYLEVKERLAEDNPIQWKRIWNEVVLQRYEQQKTNPNPIYQTTVHVVRIGDVVICTNPFELFGDFGIQMQARSPAVQTFVVQLADGVPFSYLATERAVAGGGYSAIVQSNAIGPEGGQMLVDRTVELINSIWKQ